MSNAELIESTVDSVLRSKKYEGIYRPTVERITTDFINRYPKKELEKSVKRELHRIYGSFLSNTDYSKLVKKAKEQKEDGTDIFNVIDSLLRLQTSTDERRGILDAFYSKIFDITGIPKKVVEYGCGVNALTYPYMGSSVGYVGYDLDSDLIDFINTFFDIYNFDLASVGLGDILLMDFEECDITFLFKLIPLLEKQESGSSLDVLEGINSKYIVVSYPTNSISGKDKGMVENYRGSFFSLINGKGWVVEEVLFDSELVFIVRK